MLTNSPWLDVDIKGRVTGEAVRLLSEAATILMPQDSQFLGEKGKKQQMDVLHFLCPLIHSDEPSPKTRHLLTLCPSFTLTASLF